LHPNTCVNEPQSLADLTLSFTQEELLSYTTHRKTGLAKKSIHWLDKASHLFWLYTEGIISKENLDKLRRYIVNKYATDWSKSKVLSFAIAFLKYLSKIRLDTRYGMYELFLERPKVLKERKHVTNRIVTKEDIENVLSYIAKAECEGHKSLSSSTIYMVRHLWRVHGTTKHGDNVKADCCTIQRSVKDGQTCPVDNCQAM
jgi:hypothetical protein